jgi:hypothetical protein
MCASSAGVNASALVVASSVGKGANVTLSPAGALPAGVRKVIATAKYGLVSVRTICLVNVTDRQAPNVTQVPVSGAVCVYPSGRSPSACFLIRDLAKVTDNCKPVPSVQLRSCTVTANGASTDCFQDSLNRVCVKYNNGSSNPLTATALFTATDGAGNVAPAAAVRIIAFGTKPAPVPAGCRAK